MSFRLAVIVVTVCVGMAPLSGVSDDTFDSTERDYAEQLPRLKPVEPADALATFSLAKGFRMEQVAAEPLVVDPIAMAFDEFGRLFVIEMRGYSEQGDENLGRVRVLIDKDNDGQYETSHVFAEGLSWPTGVICSRGGLFVVAAPDLIWLKDTDGDHIADEKQTVATGFGRSNVQGLVNSLKWGMDNRIHGATSSSGASLKMESVADESPVLRLRGRDFAFDTFDVAIAATSGGGQHGMSFNRWGDKFVCSNSDHIQHVQYEDRYVARNPYYAAPSARKSIAVDGPQADVFRTSPIEPWRVVRTRLRVKGIVPGPVEGGGAPAGYFTGATGVTIFRGNGWPAKFNGIAIVGDVGSNLIHRKTLTENGVGYVANRIDQKSEFVASSDTWFRPAQFANGPDGSLYVADMYRETIEHPKSLPPVIKKHLDLTSGRDRGRIYRIVGDDFEQPAPIKLGDATNEELVATLSHENGWHRETAARLLYERTARGAAPMLRIVVKSGELPEGRVRALNLLASLDMLSEEDVLMALKDTHPRVREHGVRLAEGLINESATVRSALVSMTADDAFRVRCQLGFTLGEASFRGRDRCLADLIVQDGKSPAMQLAVMSSLGEGAGEVLSRLANSKSAGQPHVRQMISIIAGQIGKQQAPEDVAVVLQLMGELSADAAGVRSLVIEKLAVKTGGAFSKQLAAITRGESENVISEVLAKASKTAVNETAKVESRTAAIAQLRLGDFAKRRALFASLLSVSQPQKIQQAAVATMASFEGAGVADLIVERWSSLSPAIRNQASDVLFSRATWAKALLSAVETKAIAVADIDASRRMILKSHPDDDIRRRAETLFSTSSSATTRDLLIKYNDALRLKGDVANGKAVFKKVCSSCHQLEGVGTALAPNLAAMKNRGREAILTNVLAPNREVNPQYLSYLLETTSGKIVTGMIAAESATSITLKRGADNVDTVLRVDIESLKSSGLSLMPEELHKEINVQAMADLIEYIESVK